LAASNYNFISFLFFQVSETDRDPKTSSEALGLAKNVLGDYEFIVAIVIWYEVLFAVNLVSKSLQTKDMLIDVAIEKVEGLISFFEGYREIGFLEALGRAKEIALELDIGASFHEKREIKRKRLFDTSYFGLGQCVLRLLLAMQGRFHP
jgi:uncharacterized membrane protein